MVFFFFDIFILFFDLFIVFGVTNLTNCPVDFELKDTKQLETNIVYVVFHVFGSCELRIACSYKHINNAAKLNKLNISKINRKH